MFVSMNVENVRQNVKRKMSQNMRDLNKGIMCLKMSVALKGELLLQLALVTKFIVSTTITSRFWLNFAVLFPPELYELFTLQKRLITAKIPSILSLLAFLCNRALYLFPSCLHLSNTHINFINCIISLS